MRGNRLSGILSDVKISNQYTHCQRSAIAQRSLFRKVNMIWFKMYVSWAEIIDELTDAEAGRFLKALMAYEKTGEIKSLTGTERIMYNVALKQIKQDAEHVAEISRIRSEARRGTLKKSNESNNDISYQMISNDNNCKEKSSNDTQIKELRIKNKELRERDIEKECADAQPAPEKKPQKHRHGNYQHVLLTDDEFEKLQAEFPDNKGMLYIQKLDDYLENNPAKHYANHSLTIHKWIEKDEKEEAQRKKAQPQQPQQVNQYPDMYARLKAEGVIP